MSYMDQPRGFDEHVMSQAPLIIFEKESDKETTKAEERLDKQDEAQKKIEEEINRKKEELRNKAQK
jgi:hypothetical protein